MTIPAKDNLEDGRSLGCLVQQADVSTAEETERDAFRDTRLSAGRFAVLSIGLCLGLFLSMLDASIVATSLYTIGSEFNALPNINWVALAYTLAFLSCSVLFARMADIVGRRSAFMGAFVIFFSFSLGCGFAPNLPTLVACRAMQGIGGSGLFSITMIIGPELSPEHLKPVLASIVGIVIAMAGVLGPVLGGVLTHYASWRWVFWMNAPIGLVSMVIFWLTWPDAEHLPNIEQRSVKDMDIAGSLLTITSAVLVVFSFQNAGNEADQWGRAIFLVPLVMGILSWIALFAWERFFERRWSNKMAAFPLGLMCSRVYTFGLLHTAFLGFSFMTTIYAFPLRLQVVNGRSPLMAGVWLLPMLGAAALATAMGGAINSKRCHICETLCVAAALVAIGCSLETASSSSSALGAETVGFLVLIGFGFGLSTSSSTILTMYEAPIHEHAPAQGILAQARILGGSIGIAASSAILGVCQRKHLAGQVALSAIHGSQADLTPDQRTLVRVAFNDAFTEAMAVCAAVSGVAVLLGLGTLQRNCATPEERRKAQVTEEIERRKALRAAAEPSSAGASS